MGFIIGSLFKRGTFSLAEEFCVYDEYLLGELLKNKIKARVKSFYVTLKSMQSLHCICNNFVYLNFGLLMCVGDGLGTFVGLRNSIIGGKRFCSSTTRPLDRLCEYCGLRGIAPKHPLEQLPWCLCKLSALILDDESEDIPDVPELIEQLDKLESPDEIHFFNFGITFC